MMPGSTQRDPRSDGAAGRGGHDPGFAETARYRLWVLQRRVTLTVERRIRVARAGGRLRAILRQSFPDVPVGAWRVEQARATSGSRVVFRIGSMPGSPDARRLIVKTGTSGADRQGLRMGARALEALHGDPRLGMWRSHVPVPLAAGEFADTTYLIATEMPGVTPVARDEHSRHRLSEKAAALIDGLHAATREPVDFDESLAEAWVRAPIRAMAVALDVGRGGDRVDPRAHGPLAALDDEVSNALARVRPAAATTHGDYWPGNLLEADGHLTAVIDWETMSRHVPAIDLVHLLVHLRRDRRRSIGQSIAELLTVRPWDDREAGILARTETSDLGPRPLLLLHWLHFVAGNLRRHPRAAASAAWLRLNVRSVIDVLGDRT